MTIEKIQQKDSTKKYILQLDTQVSPNPNKKKELKQSSMNNNIGKIIAQTIFS